MMQYGSTVNGRLPARRLYRARRACTWLALLASALPLLASRFAAAQVPDTGWPHYGNDPGGTRYSTLTQIARTNVGKLRIAWTYRTGALDLKTDLRRKAAFQATPILVGGRLYLSTPFSN